MALVTLAAITFWIFIPFRPEVSCSPPVWRKANTAIDEVGYAYLCIKVQNQSSASVWVPGRVDDVYSVTWLMGQGADDECLSIETKTDNWQKLEPNAQVQYRLPVPKKCTGLRYWIELRDWRGRVGEFASGHLKITPYK